MSAHILLLLYVLSAWGASLNFPAWARLAVLRLRDKAAPARVTDTILFTRVGLTILSFGIAGLAGVRVFGALLGDTPIQVPSSLGMLFIGCMALAEPLFLRVDEVHARARGSRSLGWRLYWVGAVSAITAFIILAP